MLIKRWEIIIDILFRTYIQNKKQKFIFMYMFSTNRLFDSFFDQFKNTCKQITIYFRDFFINKHSSIYHNYLTR